jgi:hypothetical protein
MAGTYTDLGTNEAGNHVVENGNGDRFERAGSDYTGLFQDHLKSEESGGDTDVVDDADED